MFTIVILALLINNSFKAKHNKRKYIDKLIKITPIAAIPNEMLGLSDQVSAGIAKRQHKNQKRYQKRFKVLLVVLILAIFLDIMLISVLLTVFTNKVNLISGAVIILLTNDEQLKGLGLDPEKWAWDFSGWSKPKPGGGGGAGSGTGTGWCIDPQLRLRQKTLKVFEASCDTTFLDNYEYIYYGIGLREGGRTTYYDYSGVAIEDADPVINLVGTGLDYNISNLENSTTWQFKQPNSPAVSPFQFIGIYSPNKMRYQVQMDYINPPVVTDLYINNAIQVGDKTDDDYSFARPNPLYLPDLTYSYIRGMETVESKQRDLPSIYPNYTSLSPENQALYKSIVYGYYYGWGDGFAAMDVDFLTKLGDYLNNGNTISDIVGDTSKYWNGAKLIVTYSWQDLIDWCTTTLAYTPTKHSTQGYTNEVGLYAAILGYIEWQELTTAINSADKQGGAGGAGTSSLISPIANTPFYISSQFGERNLRGTTEVHKGIDIAGPGIQGKPIQAIGDGIVIYNGTDDSGGNVIMYRVMVNGEPYDIACMHMVSKSTYPVGATVGQGDVLGAVGNSGSSTGAHLHFEVHERNNHIQIGIIRGSYRKDGIDYAQPPKAFYYTAGLEIEPILSASGKNKASAKLGTFPSNSFVYTTINNKAGNLYDWQIE